MTIIFSPEQTIIVEGKIDHQGIKILSGKETNERIVNSIFQTLSAVIKKQDQSIRIFQTTVEEKGIIVIFQSKKEEERVQTKFVLILNPLLDIPNFRNKLVQKLSSNISNITSTTREEISYLLQEIEKEELKKAPSDFLNYMPLLVNSLFSTFEEEFLYKKSKEELFRFSKNEHPVIIILRDLFLTETSDIAQVFDILSSTTLEEKLRFQYNLASLFFKLNMNEQGVNLIEPLFHTPFSYINQLSRCLLAYYLQSIDSNFAKTLITEVDESFIFQLSQSARVKFHTLKGKIFEMEKIYKESYFHYATAVSLATSLTDVAEHLAFSYLGIGNIMSVINDFEKAIFYFSLAESIFEYLELQQYSSIIHQNIQKVKLIQAKNYFASSIISLNEEKHEDSMFFLQKSIALFAKILLETPSVKQNETSKEILSILSPLKNRLAFDTLIEEYDKKTFNRFNELFRVTRLLIQDKSSTNVINTLNFLSKPEKITISQVLFIHNDGRLMYSYTSKNTSGFEKDFIFAGVISAIQMLLSEALNTQNFFNIDAGNVKLYIKRGKFSSIIFVVNIVNEQMKILIDSLMERFETDYMEQIKNWDGDLRLFEDLDKIIEEIVLSPLYSP